MQGRGAPYVHRLAMLFALLDGERAIDGQHARAALAVWDYSAASADHLFGEISGDRHRDRILAALNVASDGLTRTEVNEVVNRHLSRKQLDGLRDSMHAADLITVEKVPGDGRSAERWSAKHANEAKEGHADGAHFAYFASFASPKMDEWLEEQAAIQHAIESEWVI